jgi:enoyl-CoA hydratase/carnithine racemase
VSLVQYESSDHIATITLDRPEALNAISGAMADELAERFARAAMDDDAWVVIVRAAGEKAFCVGADLKERAGASLEELHRNRSKVRGMFDALRAVPQPTIAAIFGFALGGGFEIALSCDLVVAAQGTKVGLPETKVGLLPAGGGTQLLTRKVGTGRAKDLIFRGRLIDAQHASDLGIVAEVCDPADLDEHTRTVAREICKSSPIAVRQSKRAIDGALGDLAEGIELEHQAWEVVIRSSDRAEGITAFVEKRDAEWKNR